MINFRVIRVGDIIKNLVKLGILVLSIFAVTRFFVFVSSINLKSIIDDKKTEIYDKTFFDLLDENLDGNYIRDKKNEENFISTEFKSLILSFSGSNDNVEVENIGDISDKDAIEDYSDEVLVSPDTAVVSEHNKEDIYNCTYSTVKIRNQTSVNLTQEMLTPDVEFDKSNVIIFHTHTSESYTPTENYTYESSGNFRTLNTDCSVVGVGNELTKRLENRGINVIHDSTFHDYPEYNGAYSRSLETVQCILSNTQADLVIDLHRDAIADSTYGPSVMIGEEKAAQLMFVMGSNEGGLSHPNWNQNLKIAIKIQEKANEMYPGLFKPILLTKYRYNEHLAKGSCIIEVGATGNTIEECLVSMKYLAEVINNL